MYLKSRTALRATMLGVWAAGLLVFLFLGVSAAHAQGPTPTPPSGSEPGPFTVDVVRIALDTLFGRTTTDAAQLFLQSEQAAVKLINTPAADLFFFDFGNPNLGLNQFAAEVARNLLALTPLYAIGYLVILVYNVWKERPIPNPILYAALVIGVMLFLAAFAVITQGVSEVGRALVVAVGGAGTTFYPQATLQTTVVRILLLLQKTGGILSSAALLVAIVEAVVILIQLAYRGISMAIWRLLGVLLIPLSVLVEGVRPKTAGQVVSGFFEAWLDMVGKVALLLIVLSLASADAFADLIWFILPAGLLIVVSSWKFFGVLYTMLRDAAARAWTSMVPAPAAETSAPLPANSEAAHAQDIDAERRRLLHDE